MLNTLTREHKIIEQLKTPARNHLKFPGAEGKRKKQDTELLSIEETIVAFKRSMVPENFTPDGPIVKKRKLVEMYSSAEVGVPTSELEEGCQRQDADPLKTPNITDTCRMSLKDIPEKSKPSLGKDIPLVKSRSFLVKPKQQSVGGNKMKGAILEERMMKKVNITQPSVNAGMEKRQVTFLLEATNAILSPLGK